MITITHEELNKAVSAYHSVVYRLAFGYTGNKFDAEDMTQEAFLRLYTNKSTFKTAENEKAFLIRVTVNLCKNLLKSSWYKKRAVLVENLLASEVISEDENVLREYIGKLKHNYRTVIFLYYFEGYSVTEIAKILKISESNVKMRLSRARSQLKTVLTDDKEWIL